LNPGNPPGSATSMARTGAIRLPTDRHDTLWRLEPATAAKHRLYKKYLDAWWPILLQPSASTGRSWPHVTYVDAFAGPGEYVGGEEGSPVLVLDRLLRHDAVPRMQLKRERVHVILTEERRDRFEHLKALLARRFGPLDRLPVTVIPPLRGSWHRHRSAAERNRGVEVSGPCRLRQLGQCRGAAEPDQAAGTESR
jgi:hypothetical protein